MNDQRLPVCFVHVPKCAGKSLYALVSGAFDPRDICPQPKYGLWTWHASEVSGYKLYFGHMSMDFVAEFGKPVTTLLMLRHPLARVVSVYDFWRSYKDEFIRTSLPPPPWNGPAAAKAGDLTTFLNSDSPFVRSQIYNCAARQLLGARYDALQPDEDALLAAALDVLARFDWIGITEAFGKSMRWLREILALPPSELLPRVGDTYDVADDPDRVPVEKTTPTPTERSRILDGNRIDLALYLQGCERLSRALGEEIGVQVSAGPAGR